MDDRDLWQDSTLADVAEDGGRFRLAASRVALVILLLVVLAGGVGLLGVRSEHATASAAGYDLDLTYPRLARAGLDTPFVVEVGRDAALPGEITLAVTGDYFDIFETQGFHPEPDSETRDGSRLYLTFVTEPGTHELVVSYDAYIQPSSQRGRDVTVELIVDGATVASADATTWLWP